MPDPQLLSAMLDPALARGLPEGSRERALVSQSIRRIWHVLFDPCPTLLARHGELFEPFLTHATARGLPLDWTLHAHAAHWLGDALDEALAFELAAATAARWARSDLGEEVGVLVGSGRLPGRAIAAWKATSLEAPKRVLAVGLDGVHPPDAPMAWLPLPSRDALGHVGATPAWVYQER